MATKTVKEYTAFFDGISDFPKTGGQATSQYGFPTEPASYQLGRSIDHRTDTRSIQLLPKTIKKSSDIVVDLIKWAVTIPDKPYNTYLYGDFGNIYLRDASINYSLKHHVDGSNGNGLEWFGVDKFLYYSTDDNLGRFGGQLGPSGSPLFYDNIYVGQSGNVANTAVLSCVAALNQYAYSPSVSNFEIIGDISLFANAYMNATIPLNTVVTLVSKWDDTGNQRSYIFEVIGGVDADTVTMSFRISDDGTTEESYTKSVTITAYAEEWHNYAVTWEALTSTATFYVDNVSQGTDTHAMTSIFNSTADLSLAANRKSSISIVNFLDGAIDNVSLFNVVITNATTPNLTDVYFRELQGTETGLQAYWKFNFSRIDSTLNGNSMILEGTDALVNRYESTFDTQNQDIIPTGLSVATYPGPRPDIDIPADPADTGQTYTVPTSVSESATNMLPFVPTKDPQRSMAFIITTLGTGNLELIIHDKFNTVIADVTLPVGHVSQSGYFEFVYPDTWTPNISNNYHAHLISTVADTTIQTKTISDLSTAWYETFFGILIEDQQYHPIKQFQDFLVIGNASYIATYDGITYNPNALVLDPGWKVRCLGFWNEYLAIGAWKGDTVDQFDQGRIFFWDGVNPFGYNFFIDVPEGAINAMVGTKGQLYFIAGSRCKLMVYEGAVRARKVKNLVNSDNQNTIDIFPGAMSMWRLLLRFGVAGGNDDAIIQQGVYTWGTVNEKYPDSLSFDYVISTGDYQGTGMQIGCVQAVLGKLLIGWAENGVFGVDEVDVANDPYAAGTIQFLIEDDDVMYHQKEAITVTTQFEPLRSGESLTLKYRLDRNASFTTLPPITTVGQTTSRDVIAIGNKRYREYEIGLDLATSSSTSPIPLSVSIEKDVLSSEKRVG